MNYFYLKNIILLSGIFSALMPAAHAVQNILPFKVGDKDNYSVKYKFLSGGCYQSEVVSATRTPTGTLYHFRSIAKSSATVSAFYPIKLTFDSYWDTSISARSRFEMHGRDGPEHKDQIEILSSANKKCTMTETVTKISKNELAATPKPPVSFPMNQYSQDLVSSLYFIRTLSLPTSPAGKLSLAIVYDCEPWTLTITYLESETVDVKGEDVDANVYSLSNTNEKGETSTPVKIWVTTDPSHTIALIQGSIPIGKVKARLQDTADCDE